MNLPTYCPACKHKLVFREGTHWACHDCQKFLFWNYSGATSTSLEICQIIIYHENYGIHICFLGNRTRIAIRKPFKLLIELPKAYPHLIYLSNEKFDQWILNQITFL